MDYLTNVTYLTLAGHIELETYRYLYFMLTFTAYLFIICCNAVVIAAIYKNQSLHEPMYIFIAALLFNALFGATAFYPKLLIDLVSERQVVSYQVCLFQAFLLYAYGSAEYTLLSAMAYDRYISICKPLQYAVILRFHNVRKLLFLSWFLPIIAIGALVILTSQRELCRFRLNRVYCDNYSVVKLSCINTAVSNIYGLLLLCIFVFVPIICIIYSYSRILYVCLNNSQIFRKALQTCLPHFIIITMLAIISCFEIINNRLESNQIPHVIAIIFSVQNFFIPPLLNPIIYGLKLRDIFNAIKKILLCTM